MIGTDATQYIRSEKLKGIVVTRRDYEQLRDENPDGLIMEEAKRIMMTNAELRQFEPECVVIVYKKMKHLDSIRTHISNIGLATSMDVKNRIIPQMLMKACSSLQSHSDDLAFYIMKVYEPNYKISEYAPEERTVANCGERELNVASIMREMEFSDGLAKGADKIYRDGPDVSNILAFCINAFMNYRSYVSNVSVDADLQHI